MTKLSWVKTRKYLLYMNSHNLGSDISITTVYTQQIINFMILNPSSANITYNVLTEPRLSCVISCYDCPSLGQLKSNSLIKACFVSPSILSGLHIWIGEDSWALNLLSRIFLFGKEKREGEAGGGGGVGRYQLYQFLQQTLAASDRNLNDLWR